MKIKLGELADIMTGNTPSMKVNEYYDSNDIPFIKPDSFKSHFELEANSFISNKAERKARIVESNCILVSCIGIIGKVGITSQKVAFNQQINSLNVKPHYDIEYIAYNLLFNKDRLQRICNSAVVPLINKTQFSDFEISINKDIIIQRDIKSKLNLLSSIIKKNKKKLLLLDDIVKSRFIEMFGDLIINSKCLNTKKLGELFLLKAGITTDSNDILSYMTSSHKYLCYGGNGVRGYTKYFSYSGTFPLIGRQGALCGNVQLAQGSFHATEHAILVKPLVEYIDVIWAYYALRALDLFRYHTGAAQPGISVKTLNNILLPIPILSEQKKFVLFSNQINKLKSDVQKSIDETQLLMDSLMQEYFG